MMIRDVMTPQVEVIPSDLSLKDAARLMRDQDIGALPVAEGNTLVGMLTDRDMVVRGLAEDGDVDSLTAGQTMTPGLRYCFDDEAADKVASEMGDNQVRRLPVFNRDRSLVGIVSLGDVALSVPEKAAGEALEEISRQA